MGDDLPAAPFKEVPPGPAPGENIHFDTFDHTHIAGADESDGEYAVLKETGVEGAYIASTVTVADWEP